MNNEQQQTINQRLSVLVDELERGSKASFAKKIGVAVQSIHDLIGGRQGMPSFKVISSIMEQYPVVDANWLITGHGQMLREAVPPPTITVDDETHSLTVEQWEMIRKAILETTPAKAAAQVETEWLGRTYHFGDERTPGLPYDDRFSMRTGITGEDLQEFINTPEQFNQLRHTKIGNRILVTERAIREWFGDLPKLS